MVMRICALRQDRYACGEYRITHPMAALEARGHQVEIVQLTPGRQKQEMPSWWEFDVVILQRWADPRLLEIIRGVCEKPPKVIFEIDDLCWATDRDRPAYTERQGPGILRTMRGCDAVFASTPELAEQCRKFSPNVHWLPNSIDFGGRNWRGFAPRHPFEGKVVIGWASGMRPVADWAEVGNALNLVLAKYDQAHVALLCDPRLAESVRALCCLPRERVTVLSQVPFSEYPQVLSQFDIGLAPIQDNLFNRCKSDLKLMEYGAWGIPYVASDVAPYRRFHFGQLSEQWNNPAGGFLARTANEWRLALERLLSDPEGRLAMGLRLKRYIEQWCSLDRMAPVWEAKIAEVVNGN